MLCIPDHRHRNIPDQNDPFQNGFTPRQGDNLLSYLIRRFPVSADNISRQTVFFDRIPISFYRPRNFLISHLIYQDGKSSRVFHFRFLHLHFTISR